MNHATEHTPAGGRSGVPLAGGNAPLVPIVSLGMGASLFLTITYVVCVLFGILVSEKGLHVLLPMVLPGFIWITWPSFFIGLVASYAFGWYVALVFGPIYNFFAARRG